MRETVVWCLLASLVVWGLLVTVKPASTSAQGPPAHALERIFEIQERNTDRLLAIEGVVGTATGLGPDGAAVIKVYTVGPGIAGLPRNLEGVPVKVEVTGALFALVDPATTDRWPRPVPIGVSTGNEGEISAGTIGARVVDDDGAVYALSNNHVYALGNDAPIGSKVLQPGRIDTGGYEVLEANVIGLLDDFEPIVFTTAASNRIDAAIALSSTDLLGNATPSDGYGIPSSDTVLPVLGEAVQKYGRTTQLTRGEITGINGTFNIGYSSGTARFVDQIVVTGPRFIKAGDSGSLLVTDPGCNPVGLLSAGSRGGRTAIANPIDPVLARFEVSIDDAPAAPVTDIGVTDVSAPASVLPGDTVTVTVTVANVGDEDVAADIIVTLTDETDIVIIGTGTIVDGLVAGASATLEFPWDTTEASLGSHILEASHNFLDDNNVDNDSNTTEVTVTEPGTAPVVEACTPDNAAPGDRLTVAVEGSNFQVGATVDFGGQVIVQAVTFVDPSQLDVRIKIQRKAASGLRDVTVTNPDGQSGSSDCFTVN